MRIPDPTDGGSLVASYLYLRRAIGCLGAALPFALLAGGLATGVAIEDSMSSYYHSDMRNIFVGTLCAIGVFMLSYRGNEWEDRLAGNLACAFAVGVALFPVNLPNSQSPIGYFHYAFAGALFLTLSYFSLCLFTRTHADQAPTRRKLQRNIVYRVCGWTMLAAMVMIAVVKLLWADSGSAVFWLEALTVVAFGVSWLTKGEAILKDEEQAAATP